jgi:hypothetical protein
MRKYGIIDLCEKLEKNSVIYQRNIVDMPGAGTDFGPYREQELPFF